VAVRNAAMRIHDAVSVQNGCQNPNARDCIEKAFAICDILLRFGADPTAVPDDMAMDSHVYIDGLPPNHPGPWVHTDVLTELNSPADFLLYLKGVSPKGWLTQDAHIREESRLQMLATFDELLKKLTAAKTPPRKWRLPIVDTTPVATFTLRNWESLLADEVFSNMRFQTEGQMLPAHKCVLAAASPYFAALFRGDWLDMQGPVMITSNSLPVMRAVLRFLYTGVLNEDILSEYLLELVDVSAEYQLKMRICVPSAQMQMLQPIQQINVICPIKCTPSYPHIHTHHIPLIYTHMPTYTHAHTHAQHTWHAQHACIHTQSRPCLHVNHMNTHSLIANMHFMLSAKPPRQT